MVAISVKVSRDLSETSVLKMLHDELIRNFMDVIVLSRLKGGMVSGYDLIRYVHERFGFLASTGTVYSLLYSLERSGLVEGIWVERRREYRLTKKGSETVDVVLKSQAKIRNYFSLIFCSEEAIA